MRLITGNWKSSGLPAEVGLNLPNSGSNISIARRDGAGAAARRGLQLARRVVGVSRLSQFVEISYCRKYVIAFSNSGECFVLFNRAPRDTKPNWNVLTTLTITLLFCMDYVFQDYSWYSTTEVTKVDCGRFLVSIKFCLPPHSSSIWRFFINLPLRSRLPPDEDN
jgi:hypothetical protein